MTTTKATKAIYFISIWAALALTVALWITTTAYANTFIVICLTVALASAIFAHIITGTRRGNTNADIRAQHYYNEYE